MTWNFASILSGSDRPIEVTITEGEPMDINDQAVAESPVHDPDHTNNTATDGLSIREDANLRVTKDCKPDGDLLAGDTGTCTILVHNLGPSVAENVEVVDTHVSHDAAFTIDGVTPPVVGPNGCSIAGGVVTCNFATMLVGTDQKIEVTIAEDNPRDINDTVSVSSDMFDSDLNNNIAADGLHIVGSANVSITKSDAPDPVNAGQDLTYTLTIANAGPSTAVGVVVNDAVPAGTSMVSAVASQGSCTPGVPGDFPPQGGAIWWADNMVVPQGAEHPVDALTLMDYYYDPVPATMVTEWVLYMSPVSGVQERIRQDAQAAEEQGAKGYARKLASTDENPFAFPDEATLARTQPLKQITTDAELEEWNAIFGPISQS